MSANQQTWPDARSPRRVHPWNLVLGLAFLAVAGAWAAVEHDVVEGYEVGRLLAWGLIGLGVVGIAGTLVVTRRGRPRPAAPRNDISENDSEGDDHELT